MFGKLAFNLTAVRSQIDNAVAISGRRPEVITLIAVTKNVAAEIVQEAINLGIRDIGENRVQEAAEKFPKLVFPPNARRHMIGHLQKNKVAKAVELFDVIHSVDSVSLAAEIDKRAGAAGKVMAIFLEVNVSGEESKLGFTSENLLEQIANFSQFSHLQVEGLMTMAPLSNDPEEARPHFRKLATLAQSISQRGLLRVTMDQLSMGMSDDFPVAVEEGATMIRIGRALFGERKDS